MTSTADRGLGGLRRDAAALEDASPVFALTELFVIGYVVVGFGAYQLGTVPRLALAMLGITCAFLAPRQALWKMPLNLWLVALVMWTAATYTWSANFYQTKFMLRTEIPLMIAGVCAFAILPLERFKQALLRAIYVSVAITIFAIATRYDARVQIDAVTGLANLPGWHGFFVHKNQMTPFLAMAMVSVLAFEPSARVRRWFVVITVVLVFAANSSTGLSALMVIAVVRFWLKAYDRESEHRRGSFIALSVMLLAVSFALIIVILPVIVNLYGKDLTFTGRTEIWSAAWWAIQRNPFFGYGRGGVWTSTLLEPTNQMDKRIGFEAGHAHEAYLELLLEIGLVGLVLYVGLFFSAMRAAWRRLGDQKDIATWALLCGVSQFVISLSETPAFGIWVVLLGAMHMMSMRRYDVPGGYGVIETNWRVNPVGGTGVNRAH